MNSPEAWGVAFNIYQQGWDMPEFRKKLKTNDKVRGNILTQLREGISELEKLGAQDVANVGRELYNNFSGTNTYRLVSQTPQPSQEASKEIIQVYARHGDDSGSRLSEYGVSQSKNLGKKMLEVYAGRTPKVYTSPLGRAVHTAEIVGGILNANVESREELELGDGGIVDFVSNVKEDAIFIGHQPDLVDLCGRSLGNCQFVVKRRTI